MSIRVLRGFTRPLPFTAGSALLLLVACSKPAPKEEAKPVDSSGAAATAAPAADATLTAGFIYVGPKDDYGYNQAHAEAAKSVSQMPGVKVTEQASVEETAAVQEVMETMIRKDGAKLLFPTSFGYFDPHILKVAAKHPEVTFYHCGGL